MLTLAACSFGGKNEAGPAELASGEQLPTRCLAPKVEQAETVTFVANGRGWALDPRSGRLGCLFTVQNAGPFAWGPRGDRALLARLQVKALPGAPTRRPSDIEPRASSWGRPTGKSIVFVGRGGRALLKAHPGSARFVDVTPVKGVRYEHVVYHPSGLAFAFVLRQGKHESIWISSNVGKKPQKLVHGRLHTGFDAIAFGDNGQSLYFAAQHVDHRVDVHSLQLVGATSAPVVWRGAPEEHVTDLVPGGYGQVAFTVGRSCETRHAVIVTPTHKRGSELLKEHSPSRVVGWYDRRHLLVAAGGCGDKLDLYSVADTTLNARLLVRNVDAASVRRAEEFPPPPLPPSVLGEASSFA